MGLHVALWPGWFTCLPSSMWGPDDSTTSTQFGSLNLTKPKPLDLPVVWFFITTQSMTSPYRLKYFNMEAEDRKAKNTCHEYFILFKLQTHWIRRITFGIWSVAFVNLRVYFILKVRPLLNRRLLLLFPLSIWSLHLWLKRNYVIIVRDFCPVSVTCNNYLSMDWKRFAANGTWILTTDFSTDLYAKSSVPNEAIGKSKLGR